MSNPTIMQEAELRASVEPLDQLIAERQVLVTRLAPLWAAYGPGSVAEQVVSAERARISGMLRAMAAADEKKITESALEEGARSHPDYLTLLAKQTTERAEYFKLNAALQEVEMRCNRGQALIRMASAEARL